jgi:acetoin utilization protein AcuB
MSPSPHSIGVDQSLETAHHFMREHAVRHLPVLDGGRLVGMVSQRDLLLVETLPDVAPEKITVEEAMSRDVYAASPDELLEVVARTMADRKLGAAVALERERVVGVFTTTDALETLADLLGS